MSEVWKTLRHIERIAKLSGESICPELFSDPNRMDTINNCFIIMLCALGVSIVSAMLASPTGVSAAGDTSIRYVWPKHYEIYAGFFYISFVALVITCGCGIYFFSVEFSWCLTLRARELWDVVYSRI